MSIGDFLEIVSQQILVGMILAGRLGARRRCAYDAWLVKKRAERRHSELPTRIEPTG